MSFGIELRWGIGPVVLAIALAALGSPSGAQTTIIPLENSPASTDPWCSVIDRLRRELRDDVGADQVGGITAAVVRGDRMVWAEGFGWADREQGVPAGVETVYRIGSLSKPIAAVALTQLAQDDKLDLDDPVTKYVAEASMFINAEGFEEAITLRHLVTHTSGLVREPALSGHSFGPVTEWESKVLASISTTQRVTPPGEAVAYSNIGFATLGLAVGRAAETPYIELVEQQIFARLQMRSTGFRNPPHAPGLMAVGYLNRRPESGEGWLIDAATPLREHRGRGYRVPNGGVYSTVGDLTRFIAAMSGVYGDQLLEANWREEMMRLQTPGSETSGYGLGFHIQRHDDGRRTVGHGGSVAGYTAYFAFDPEAKVGVILLRNYNEGRTNLGRTANKALRELVSGVVADER